MESRLKRPSFLLMMGGGHLEQTKKGGALTYSVERTGRRTSPLWSRTSPACTPPASSGCGSTNSATQEEMGIRSDVFLLKGAMEGSLETPTNVNKQPVAPFNKHKQGRSCLFAFIISIIYEPGSGSIVQLQLRASSSSSICMAAPLLTK